MLEEKELLENFVDEEEEKEEEILEEEQGLEDLEEGIVPELIEKTYRKLLRVLS